MEKDNENELNKQNEEQLNNLAKYDELKDNLVLNDLELFYKTGKFPYIFFLHILSTLIITIIILKGDQNLNNLMQQTRSIQSVFYFFENAEDPNDNYPRTYYFTTLPDLFEHMDKLINSIFNINKYIAYNITYKNDTNLKFQFTFRKNVNNNSLNEFPNVTWPYSIDIINSKVNPIKEYFKHNYTLIRTFLSLTKEISIELVYDYDRLKDDVCQEVSIVLSYDTSRIAKIAFTPIFYFDNCPNKLITIESFKKGFSNSYSFLSLILIIFSILQIIFLSKKYLIMFKIVIYIKKKIKNIDYNFSIEDIYTNTGKDIWDKISLKDIISLFPKFLFSILISSILNFLGGLTYIIIPFLNNINQILFGFSSIISYISIAYYFQSDKKYYLFYNTLSKSTKEYQGLLITFLLLFSGFTILHIIIFCHSDKWYDGFQGGFLTLFAATLGDLLLDIWSSTLESHPIITLIFAFILFVVFLGNHMRVMFTLTQESFQIANLENNRSWLDNKFDFRDYLKQEFNYDNEKKEKDDDKNFVVDDVWMRAIINKDDLNKLENIDFSKLKVKGYNVDAIINYLKDFRNEAKRKKISKLTYEEILYNGNNSDIIKIANKNGEIKNIFGNLFLIFDKISKISELGEDNYNILIKEICENNLEKLDKLKNQLKNQINNIIIN